MFCNILKTKQLQPCKLLSVQLLTFGVFCMCGLFIYLFFGSCSHKEVKGSAPALDVSIKSAGAQGIMRVFVLWGIS